MDHLGEDLLSRVEACLVELDTLTRRVELLEEGSASLGDSETVRRVLEDCQALGLTSSRLKRVPSDYYSHSLEQRRYAGVQTLQYSPKRGSRGYLGAPSIHHLCKSILLEVSPRLEPQPDSQTPSKNTACTQKDCSDPSNSR
jgi:hypothetical protein